MLEDDKDHLAVFHGVFFEMAHLDEKTFNNNLAKHSEPDVNILKPSNIHELCGNGSSFELCKVTRL